MFSTEKHVWLTIQYSIVVVGILVVISVLLKLTSSEYKYYSPNFINHIKRLVRQSAQFSTIAKQNNNFIVSLLYVNSALSYAYATRKLVSAEEIARIAHVNIDELIYKLEDDQLECMKSIHKKYPMLQPEGVYAAHTGWIE